MLNSKLTAGSAGNMITCRPFDASLKLYNQGNLAEGGGETVTVWLFGQNPHQVDDKVTLSFPEDSALHSTLKVGA